MHFRPSKGPLFAPLTPFSWVEKKRKSRLCKEKQIPKLYIASSQWAILHYLNQRNCETKQNKNSHKRRFAMELLFSWKVRIFISSTHINGPIGVNHTIQNLEIHFIKEMLEKSSPLFSINLWLVAKCNFLRIFCPKKWKKRYTEQREKKTEMGDVMSLLRTHSPPTQFPIELKISRRVPPYKILSLYPGVRLKSKQNELV